MDRLTWGREVVFVNGPLGTFTYSPFYFYSQSLIALLYQAALVIALFLGIARALRGRCTPFGALVCSFMATAATAIFLIGWLNPYLAFLVAFVWAAIPLLPTAAIRLAVWPTTVLLAVFAGFEFLAKLNTGLYILILALALSVIHNWKSAGRHLLTLVAFLASTLVFWMLSGQALADFPTWARVAKQVVTGYSDSMTVPLGLGALPGLALILVWFAALAALWWVGRPNVGRRYLALVILASAMSFQVAFARADSGHFRQLLGVAFLSVVITPLVPIVRRVRLGSAAAVVVILCLAANALWLHPPAKLAIKGPGQFFDRVFTLADRSAFDRRIEREKEQQRGHYQIPASILQTIGSGSVHVDPEDTSAVWAYGLNWRPAPVFQSNMATNPNLDKFNAESLRQNTDYVLSRKSEASPARGTDNRLGVQESPLYSRALLCNFGVTTADERWVLLKRSSDHCGALRLVSEVDVSDGQTVEIPKPSAPGVAVLASIDLNRSVLDRLIGGAGGLLPLDAPTVSLDAVAYRLVSANAVEPFLVRSPTSVAGTNLQISSDVLSVGSVRKRLRDPAVKSHVAFYEMAVQPAGR